jgi:ribose transport system ATP-binding protein
VLRDGKFIGALEMANATHKNVLDMMFGDLEIKTRPADLVVENEVVLSVKGLSRAGGSGTPVFKDVSFDLHKGEVLGIAGMLGAGRTELLRTIFGADRADRGSVIFNGKLVTKPTPESMRNAGLAMTPEDRKRQGLNLLGAIQANLCYASLPFLARNGFINKKRESEFALRQVAGLQIKTSSVLDAVTSLSGGNQQKVVVGNWLNTGPRVMLFDEPSRGIDVNAKQQIFQIIWEQSRRGISSIMVSSELEELLEVCHRILIMRAGRIVDEVSPENITVEKLYSLCMAA